MKTVEQRIFDTGVNMLSSHDFERIVSFFSGEVHKSSVPRKERIELHQVISQDGRILTFTLELDYQTLHWRKLRSSRDVIPLAERFAADPTIVCGR